MTNWQPNPEDFGMWVVCEAIGKDHDFPKKSKRNEDGSFSVMFSVGGVELDFNNVITAIKNSFNNAITEKAQGLLEEKYDDLLNEIDDMQKRIREQKERFKYDWE